MHLPNPWKVESKEIVQTALWGASLDQGPISGLKTGRAISETDPGTYLRSQSQSKSLGGIKKRQRGGNGENKNSPLWEAVPSARRDHRPRRDLNAHISYREGLGGRHTGKKTERKKGGERKGEDPTLQKPLSVYQRVEISGL